jgi:ribose-phosphate pyrophosphokinase
VSVSVLPYPGNEALAQAIATEAGYSGIALESRHFPDGELYFRVGEGVHGKAIVVVCSLDHPNEKALGLHLLASTLRDQGVVRLVLVAPYLPYMRQDRVFHQGEGVSARYFAKLLSLSFDALVTVDPHLHRIHALADVYSIPSRTVHAAPAIAGWIAANVNSPIIIGPDSESEQWARDIARRAGCPVVVLEKRRTGDRDVEVSVPDVELLRGRTPVLVDDIISTARTMIAAVRHVRSISASAPICIGVHAIFADDALNELAAAGAGGVVSCNTVLHPTNAIDIAPLLRGAIASLM